MAAVVVGVVGESIAKCVNHNVGALTILVWHRGVDSKRESVVDGGHNEGEMKTKAALDANEPKARAMAREGAVGDDIQPMNRRQPVAMHRGGACARGWRCR